MKFTSNWRKVYSFIKPHFSFSNVTAAFAAAILIGWCTLNVASLLNKYFLAKTMVSLQSVAPDRNEFPGVTICAPSIFKPDKLAQLFPETFGKKFHQDQSDDDLNIIWDLSRNTLLRQYENYAMQNYSAYEVIRTLSVRVEELIPSCRYHPVNIRNYFKLTDKEFGGEFVRCDRYRPVIEMIYDGRKCFTFFSGLADEIDEAEIERPEIENENFDLIKLRNFDFVTESFRQMVFDLHPTIVFEVNALQNDAWSRYVRYNIQIAVHPPVSLLNQQDFVYVEVTTNNRYEISFSNRTTYFSKDGSQNCVNYDETFPYGAAIRTRDECLAFCINTRTKTKCANWNAVLLPQMFAGEDAEKRICAHEQQDYVDFLRARDICETHCRAHCHDVIYEINGQTWSEVSSDDDDDDGDDDGDYGDDDDDDYDYYNMSKSISKSEIKNDDYADYYTDDSEKRKRPNDTTRVTIKMSPKPSTVVYQKPILQAEEVLGNIGGHIGACLGLSFYKIIKFSLILFFDLLKKYIFRI